MGLKEVFLLFAFAASLFGIVTEDVVMAAFMGGSFGFQLALWLVDRDSEKSLSANGEGPPSKLHRAYMGRVRK